MQSLKAFLEGFINDIGPYVNNEECYLAVESIVEEFGSKYGFEANSGFYIDHGIPRDHAWLTVRDGTIIDPTYSQFNSGILLGVWPTDSIEHYNYHSYNTHHNPDCMLKRLFIKQKCEVCDWSGNI
jgi:hypothetical protein